MEGHIVPGGKEWQGTMTTGVVIYVPDGVAMATDSRITLVDSQEFVLSDNVAKIYPYSDRIAILHTGTEHLADGENGRTVSVTNLLRRFKREFPDLDMTEIGEKLGDYFVDRILPYAHQMSTFSPRITFWICGITEERRPQHVTLEVDTGGESLDVDENPTSIHWLSNNWAIPRLLHGIDDRILKDVQSDALEDIYAKGLYKYRIPYAFFTLQDALDLAELLVNVEIQIGRFARGIVGTRGPNPAFPGSGGRVVSAVIHHEYGFRWIRPPALEG